MTSFVPVSTYRSRVESVGCRDEWFQCDGIVIFDPVCADRAKLIA